MSERTKKPRSYSWNPEQLARINARREARGQDPYEDVRLQQGGRFSSGYDTASAKYAERQAQRSEQGLKRNLLKTQEEEEFAKRSQKMREGIAQRDRDRQDFQRMSSDYNKMRQSGGTTSWADFKKSWMPTK